LNTAGRTKSFSDLSCGQGSKSGTLTASPTIGHGDGCEPDFALQVGVR